MQETEMDFENRIITSDFTPEDNDIENSLRPKTLDDYIGQDKIKENLKIYILRLQRAGARRLTMCCFTDLRDLAKQPLQV